MGPFCIRTNLIRFWGLAPKGSRKKRGKMIYWVEKKRPKMLNSGWKKMAKNWEKWQKFWKKNKIVKLRARARAPPSKEMRLGARKKGADFDVKQTQSGVVTAEGKKRAEMHSLGLKIGKFEKNWEAGILQVARSEQKKNTWCGVAVSEKYVMWGSGKRKVSVK